jgi:hypothetical protein
MRELGEERLQIRSHINARLLTVLEGCSRVSATCYNNLYTCSIGGCHVHLIDVDVLIPCTYARRTTGQTQTAISCETDEKTALRTSQAIIATGSKVMDEATPLDEVDEGKKPIPLQSALVEVCTNYSSGVAQA